MADRIIRAELLTSEPWLALKNNDDRVAWLALALNADTFGNQPAGPHRLVHLWRHAGIDTTEKAAKVLSELHDVDLARPYEAEGKPYVHLPRFRQSRRYLGKLWPISPWSSPEEIARLNERSRLDEFCIPTEKQEPAKKSHANRSESHETAGDARTGVGVGVGVGVNQNHAREPQPVDNLKAALSGQSQPARQNPFDKKQVKSVAEVATMLLGEKLGLKPNRGELWLEYSERVRHASEKEASQ